MRRIARLLPALRRDARGVSVIELALTAPFLAFLVMGMTDLARGMANKLMLEQAAHRALEKAAVGTVQSDYTFVKTEAATAAGVPATDVTVTTWLECDGTAQAAFDGVCPAGQMYSRYVRVTINSSFRPSFNYSKLGYNVFGISAGGTLAQTGSATVRVQ